MPFSGFQEGKVRLVPIPGPFFTELLPQIDDLDELKVTLYAFHRLDRMEGTFRYLQDADFLAGLEFAAGMTEVQLEKALGRAVERGTFLKVDVESSRGVRRLYFINTPKGRAAVEAINSGEWRYSGDSQHPVEIREDLPNIYRLYEENIGILTPLIADELREAETNYPADWIRDAIRIAVENNARNWRYVSAVLNRWKEKGRDERKNRRDTEKDRRRYADWEDPTG
ncbi:MAG: DnaD domain-containing protein [Anaerolineales bacterium]